MGAETSVVIALLFLGFLIMGAAVYSSVDYSQNLVKKAQSDQDTMKKARMQTDITITNVSFSNYSGNVSLNITLKNTGKTTLNASLLSVFINGIYVDSSYCISTKNTWVSENITNISIYSRPGNITLDNATYATTRSASSITWSHTVRSGLWKPLLVVGVDIEKSSPTTSVTSITYAGVALTRADFSLSPESPQARAELWYLANPAAGTNNVVVTFSTAIGSGGAVAGAVSFSGVDQTNPMSNTATGSGSGGTASTSITTVNANAWIIDTIVVTTANSPTAISPQVARWSTTVPSGLIGGGGSTNITTNPGTQTMKWTVNDKWAQVAAEIKPLKCNTPTTGRIKVVTENGIWDYAIVS
ncbi:MAG: hypothetical protein PHU34_09935 [Candidatus Methanoperedens sp.]|nr:hypothetical protein [Candidatus Methanoperedens sp.]